MRRGRVALPLRRAEVVFTRVDFRAHGSCRYHGTAQAAPGFRSTSAAFAGVALEGVTARVTGKTTYYMFIALALNSKLAALRSIQNIVTGKITT